MKIRWSEEAARTVDGIIVDVAVRSGKARAHKLADDLAAHVAHLEAHPQMGRMVPELQRPDVREIVEGGYRVLYLVLVDEIEVLTVLRPRKPLPRLTLPPVDD